jgi:hypothetical protein
MASANIWEKSPVKKLTGVAAVKIVAITTPIKATLLMYFSVALMTDELLEGFGSDGLIIF